MKTHTKRLLSLALAVVMILALMPANALPAQAEGLLTVIAYPEQVAVGQTSVLIVTGATGDLSYATSNAAIASVTTDGVVTGVHSGTATITVTDANGATGTCDMVVTATSVYKISANVFNIGNDIDGDGLYTDADDYGGIPYSLGDGSTVTTPVWGKNPYEGAKYVPYYVTGSSSSGDSYKSNDNASDNGYIRYRGRENLLWFFPIWASYKDGTYDYRENEKYFTSYDYLNLNKTAPWQWKADYSKISYDYRIRPNATKIRDDVAWIQTQGFPDEIYTTLIIDVPASGDYTITIDTGNSGTLTEVFYLTPVGDVASNSAANLCKDANKVVEIDISTTTTGTGKKTLEKGEYYLTLQLVQGTNTSDTGYLKSITLELDEIDEPEISVDTTDLSVGDSKTLSVTQTSSLQGVKEITNATFTSDNTAVVHVTASDGTATVTAVSAGTANVTVSFTDIRGKQYTEVIAYTVTDPSIYTYDFTIKAFNIGNYDTETGEYVFHSSDTWTDRAACKFVPYYTGTTFDQTNGKIFARDTGNWYFYPIYLHSSYSENQQYIDTYDYLNSKITADWKWVPSMSYWSLSSNTEYFIVAGQSYITELYSQIRVRTSGRDEWATIQLEVPTSGTYSITVDTGSTGTVNEQFFLLPVSAGTVNNASVMCNDTYLLGNVDISAGDKTATWTKELEAGSYYFVMNITEEDATTWATDSSGLYTGYLKSLTLTPVEADLDGYTVEQQYASLSDDITMHFDVNTTGTLIAGYDVSLDGNKMGCVAVETGVTKTISVALAANQMSKTITIQPVDANGEAFGDPKEYSLREYLLGVINSADEAITEADKNMAANAYNYCAKAQLHFNKDTDVIAEDSITATTYGEPAEFAGTIVDGNASGIAARSATLLLENQVTLRVYFELDDGKAMSDYTFTVGDTTLVGQTSGTKYYVDITDINPQMYNTASVITVTDGDGNALTVTYSPMAYIQRTYYNENAKDTLKVLVQAMYDYYNAAVAYTTAG